MHKDGWYFFGTFQPPINWCEKGKKFAVFIMSARYSRNKTEDPSVPAAVIS